ncbi:hypothetical protein ACIHJG_40545 [Streptomyces sp. NPDC052415]
MRKTVIGLFMTIAAVLAAVPLASADAHHTDTVACCGGGPGHL